MNARGQLAGLSARLLPVVFQSRTNDCGPAALGTVLAWHGCPVDHDVLSASLALDRDGTDLLTLSRMAERLGFRARGVKASYDAISRCVLPAIVHLRSLLGGGHFVVIYSWTSAHVVIADPAAGMRRLSRRVLCRRSTGYILIIEPPRAG